MGYKHQILPQGIKRVHIEPFKNETLFVGPELDFTNQLVKEFQRAKVGKLVKSGESEGLLRGRVISIQRIQRAPEAQPRSGDRRARGWVNLPPGTLITTEYLLRVKVQLNLIQKSTGRVIWTQIFTDETIYPSSRLALETINTALPNYNNSEEQRMIKLLAGVMMQEAVGRLTENF
jgi:hypothetical protein